ncbi:MAG TPA: threonylcarbamoyl-AMP synthase [Rhodobacteraceae bacterium]|nr:threonylcarbamoyl-AMP synthase [Paracoccaceae bacterium]
MDNVAKIILGGGVALLPTDTVYGLMASPQHPAAIAKIFALKNRPTAKNLPILVADSAQISALGVQLDSRIKALLASRFIPGALTMVLPLAKPPSWLSERQEIAVRIPNDAALRALLKGTGPLLATSANASGRETPPDVPSILAQLSGTPDIVIDGGPRQSQPSTLIDCQTSPYSVLRRGALSDADLKEIRAL